MPSSAALLRVNRLIQILHKSAKHFKKKNLLIVCFVNTVACLQSHSNTGTLNHNANKQDMKNKHLMLQATTLQDKQLLK
jgi:hypothetical protein